MITEDNIVKVVVDELAKRNKNGELGKVRWDECYSDYVNWEVLLKNIQENGRGFSLTGRIELTIENYCGYDNWVFDSHTFCLDSMSSLSNLSIFKKDIKIAIDNYVKESIKSDLKYDLDISKFITEEELKHIEEFTSLTVRLNSTYPRLEILEVIKD